MGTWHQPDDQRYYDILRALDPGGRILADEFITALETAELIVRKAYYVPDSKELYGLMREWQYHMRHSVNGARWVMCKEAIDALAKQYKQTRAPQPLTFDAKFWAEGAGAEMPVAALEAEYEMVAESRRYWSSRDAIFGIPIRIDPAARSPMFEIDTPATRTAR